MTRSSFIAANRPGGPATNCGARRFDCAILLQNAFEAAWIAWLARIPARIGYKRDGRQLLLTRAVDVPKPGEIPRHERFYYLELLRRAGLIDTLPASPAIRLHRDEAHNGKRVIGVSPGAAYGTAKRWLPERFAEAAGALASARGASIALFGSKSERDLCEQVAERLNGCQVINYAGQTTLAQFIDLAAACEFFLTNDSGAMHIASALGVPTVAIFGATDDTTTGPTGSNARVIREPVRVQPVSIARMPHRSSLHDGGECGAGGEGRARVAGRANTVMTLTIFHRHLGAQISRSAVLRPSGSSQNGRR